MNIPEPNYATVPMIYGWHEKQADGGLRTHLGASLIGHDCNRYLWLTFRWARKQRHDGRLLRLFLRGKREEAAFIDELRGIGAEVHADDGTGQYRVSALNGHFGGSMDAVARGLPEAPKAWHVCEFKTHNDKSFKALVKNGVRQAKPQHWAQLQVYMLLAEIPRGLYLAVNKNDDSLHAERIELETAEAELLLARAEQIIDLEVPPVRAGGPDDFVCKWCEFRDDCHGTTAPLATCRTCVHATPELDGGQGRWSCARHGVDLATEDQHQACSKHRVIPILLENFAEPLDADAETVTYCNKLTGAEFVNGEGPGRVTSAEIHALADKRLLGEDRFKDAIEREFGGAEYVG